MRVGVGAIARQEGAPASAGREWRAGAHGLLIEKEHPA